MVKTKTCTMQSTVAGTLLQSDQIHQKADGCLAWSPLVTGVKRKAGLDQLMMRMPKAMTETLSKQYTVYTLLDSTNRQH